MAEEKRTRRTREEMAQVRQEKIAQLEASITELEEKKAAAIAAYDAKIAAARKKVADLVEANEPKKPGRKPAQKRRTKAEKIQDLIKQTSKSGMSMEEIASKLGIEL